MTGAGGAGGAGGSGGSAAGPAAIILAGGRAQRMGGRQKALLEVDGRAILDRQLELLRPRFARIAVVLAPAGQAAGAGAGLQGDDDDDGAPFRARGLEVVRDAAAGLGPVAGLAAGLAWAAGAAAFALACDMPFVSGAVIDLVLSRAVAQCADLVLPVLDGRPEPLCALYGARTAPVIAADLLAGRLRAGLLADEVAGAGLRVVRIDGAEIRTIDPTLRSFINVNHPPGG